MESATAKDSKTDVYKEMKNKVHNWSISVKKPEQKYVHRNSIWPSLINLNEEFSTKTLRQRWMTTTSRSVREKYKNTKQASDFTSLPSTWNENIARWSKHLLLRRLPVGKIRIWRRKVNVMSAKMIEGWRFWRASNRHIKSLHIFLL